MCGKIIFAKYVAVNVAMLAITVMLTRCLSGWPLEIICCTLTCSAGYEVMLAI